MKIEVVEEFEYEGKTYEVGKIVDLPKKVAKNAISKGYAKEASPPELSSGENKGVKVKTDDDALYGDIKEDIKGEREVPNSWNPPRDDPPKPEEHPMLIGDVVRTGKGGENNTKFAVIKDRDGEKHSLWNHKVLDDMFEQIEVGDKVGVRYTGKEQSGQSEYEYLKYRYSLRDTDGNEKVAG